MKLPSPKNVSDYPAYIFGYWIVAFLLMFSVFVLFTVLPNITNSGKYVRHDNCIRETTESTYSGDQTICLEYGDATYSTVGDELKAVFYATLIVSGVVCWGYGIFAWHEAKKAEALNELMKKYNKES